jgi:2-haloacid dehalogenase
MKIEAVVFDAYGTLYDVQSVAAVTEESFPGYGAAVTQIWRMKQLEYTWLRSLMQRYESFWNVTRESLQFTLDGLGLEYSEAAFKKIMEKYLHLDLYPDAKQALQGLSGLKIAILSNGSQDMLSALVRNSGLDKVLHATISIESKQVFKPSPRTYDLIGETLGVKPANVLFVSSNGFDACGAKSYGLNVAWIERVTAAALRQETRDPKAIGPSTVYKAMRMRMETFGLEPNYRIASLAELPALIRP